MHAIIGNGEPLTFAINRASPTRSAVAYVNIDMLYKSSEALQCSTSTPADTELLCSLSRPTPRYVAMYSAHNTYMPTMLLDCRPSSKAACMSRSACYLICQKVDRKRQVINASVQQKLDNNEESGPVGKPFNAFLKLVMLTNLLQTKGTRAVSITPGDTGQKCSWLKLRLRGQEMALPQYLKAYL